MSISMTFRPYALTIRSLMGEKAYTELIESSQLRFQTVVSEYDIIRDTLQRAGLDFTLWNNIYKTHVDSTYFIWEKEGNHWYAVFSADDPPRLVEKVSNLLSQAYGGPFLRSVKNKENYLRTTQYNDKSMLIKALSLCGMEPQEYLVDTIVCIGGKIRFQKDRNGLFQLYAHGVNLQSANLIYDKIDAAYKQILQDDAYLFVLRQVESTPAISYLDEYIDEDDTIVITLQVNE